MKALAALALLLVACGDVVDGGTSAIAEVDAPPGAEQAIGIALSFYAEQTGSQAPEVVVHWTADQITYGDTTAEGLTWGCDDIWVHRRADDLMPLTLSHELAHCVLRTVEGDGDGAHTIAAWWELGGLVDQAHVAIRAAGL